MDTTNVSSMEAAWKDFESRGLIDSLEFDQAKTWFEEKGLGDYFTYFKAKDFLLKKGHLKGIDKCYDGTGKYSFARKEERVDKSHFHDVIVAIFLSDFVYNIANLRSSTQRLAFTNAELEREVCLGDSFAQKTQATGAQQQQQQQQQVDPKKAMVMLMQGNLKVSRDPNVKSPHVDMDQLEDVLKYEGFRNLRESFANELTITAIHSFKVNKVHIHKFDAKYSETNLVYSIASRERSGNSENCCSADNDKAQVDLFLSFRGSQTVKDWFQNLQAPQVEITLRRDKCSKKCFLIEQLTYRKTEIDPELFHRFEEIIDQGPPIQVHKGFLGYLFADRGSVQFDADKHNDDSMYTNMRLCIQRLIAQTETDTNTLYVTGHSLGGALATLASFFLACDTELAKDSHGLANDSHSWKGIKCISFASPLVGNISFQRAFEVLQQTHNKEQQQSQSHQQSQSQQSQQHFSNIRFTNNRDPVPFALFLPGYRHVAGVHVHLNRPSLLSLYRPRTPTIEAEHAHWKRSLNVHHLWHIFPPTNLITGIFATTGPFFGLLVTTIPLSLILFYAMFRYIGNMLPAMGLVQDTFVMVVSVFAQWFPNAVGTTVEAMASEIGGHETFQNTLLGLLLMYFFYTLTKSNAWLLQFVVALPVLAWFALYRFDPIRYDYLATYWDVYFLTGLVVAQLAMFVFRSPSEVVNLGDMSLTTHSLANYYKNLRPNHRLTSSSAVLLEQHPLVPTNNDGDRFGKNEKNKSE